MREPAGSGENINPIRVLTGRSRTGSHLIQVPQQCQRILVDAECPSTFKLSCVVTTRKQPYTSGLTAACGKHVPDSVADHQAFFDGCMEFACSGEEKVWIGFAIFDVITGEEIDLRTTQA
jgi:hypothetical protein